MPNSGWDTPEIIIAGAFILSFVVDTILRITWNKLYFTKGLTLFTMSIPVNERHVNIPSKPVLESQFHSIWFESFVFQEIFPNTYGFREKFSQFKLMRYSPIMHGLLIFDDANSRVIVKGFANWFFLVFSLLWLGGAILFTLSVSILALFVIFFCLVIGSIYAIQHSRFSKVATIAAQAWSRRNGNKIIEA